MADTTTAAFLPRSDLDALFAALADDGYAVIGPTVRDGAIVYDELASADALPAGWTDQQAPGFYRLRRRSDDRVLGHVVGPHSWKRFFFPTDETLVQIRTREGELPRWSPANGADGRRMALLGVRACDLAALGIHDRIFDGDGARDPAYHERRGRTLVIAAQCTEAGGLCFCASTGTGPSVDGGYDVRLTETGEGFVVESGSPAGEHLVARLPTTEPRPGVVEGAREAVEECRGKMGREVDLDGLPEHLFGNLDHPRWAEVADRCLACGSCTMVCPTCFCFGVDDDKSLDGERATRTRRWDSCFGREHGRVFGGHFRPATEHRYRQWLTHKLGAWVAQFGTSGCVGCGRCIAWCPVGIDLTEEVEALRVDAAPPVELPKPTPAPMPTHHDHPFVADPCRVREVVRETPDMVTLVCDPPPGYADAPGQFNMLSLPGIGEVPISVSGRTPDGGVEHTIRKAGLATRALCALEPGDVLGLRGPYGSAWPLDAVAGGPLVVIAGGIGLAPLRQALREAAARPDDFPLVRLLYGTRSPKDIPFQADKDRWQADRRPWVSITVDRGTPGWTGNVGPVTALMRRKDLPVDGAYFICGPEVMMNAVIQPLLDVGVPAERIFVTMERNMRCAVGHCGRCQYGPLFICKDGPVFSYDRVAFLFGVKGY